MATDLISQLQLLLNQAQFTEAEALAREIVNQLPEQGDARHVLGALLLKRGSIAEALLHLKIAVALLPADVHAFNNLGCAFERNDQPREAEQSYRRACSLNPEFAPVHHNLGVILRVLGHYAESETSLRKAIALHPDYADAYFNLGLTLAKHNQSDEANACFNQALRLHPEHTHALIALGNAAASMGCFAEAEGFYRKVLAMQPGNLAAWSAIPEIRKMTPDDRDWLHASQQVAQNCGHPREVARYHFSIAKFYDDVGEPDQAFVYYQCANNLSKQFSVPYQPQQQAGLVDRICATFDKKKLALDRPDACTSARPVFIIGMPRSGTSLVEQIVASHPGVSGAGELNFWSNALPQAFPDAPSDDVAPEAIQRLGQAYLSVLAQFPMASLRVTDKAPQNFLNLGLILTVFPRARILHLQRNPIDTCLSIYFQDFTTAFSYANDLESLVHYYRQYQRLMQHWHAAIPPGQLLDVPYDALVTDQEAWSRKMIDFIGLDWDPRCLDFQQTKRKVETASQWQVRQGVYTSSVERWRKYEKYLGPLLTLS